MKPFRFATALFAAAASLGASNTEPSPASINPDGWPVHDPARPAPPVVAPRSAEALAGLAHPPDGAIMLFDGTELSAWQPSSWLVQDGYIEVTPKGGYLESREDFGSCHLHLEWRSPTPVTGSGQGRGNSGVFLMGHYEIQILDTHENPTYADGYAGAAYGQLPPLANPIRPPGEWNTYDLFFRAPRFGPDGTVLRPAAVTLIFNGILVLNNFEFIGRSTWKKVATYSPHPSKAPLRLQDHGDRVRFRNIWIVPLAD